MKSRLLITSSALTVMLGVQPALGQFDPNPQFDSDIRPNDVIHWTPLTAYRYDDHRIEIGVRLTTEKQFTIYQDKLDFQWPPGYQTESTATPTTAKLMDPIENKEVDVYTGGDFTITINGLQAPTSDQFTFGIQYTGCTQVICLFPYTETVTIQLNRPPGCAEIPAGACTLASLQPNTPESTISERPSLNFSDVEASVVDVLEKGTLPFWLILLLVAVGGLLSNLTPCVYPMIPITLRILGGNADRPFLNSSLYGTGIVVTYTSLGLFAGLTGTLFGSFMQNPIVNIAFALLMAGLAMTMLGFGNLSFLQTLGSRMGAGKPSLRNYLFMGVGAGLVAAPCVGPVLLALLAYAAKADSAWAAGQLLCSYSIGFAAPYVVLGGTAAKMNQKRAFSHHAQVAVKILFAAIMFALAFYYLRIPFYGVMKTLKEYWTYVMSAGLLLGLTTTVFWLVIPRLTHSKALLMVPSVILGIGVFGGYGYLTNTDTSQQDIKLIWHKTEAEAYAAAESSGKPLFIDGWAEWCEACKKMDATTFLEPEVRKTLAEDWVLLKLDLTESNDANDALIDRYKFMGLPSYAMIPADGDLNKITVQGGYQEATKLLKLLTDFKEGL